MSLTAKESQTKDRYNQTAARWLEVAGGEKRQSYWEKEMSVFVGLLSGKRVLDLGAGPATDSTELQNYGLEVISSDYSRGMLATAHRLNPGLSLVESDSYYSPFPDETFDGIWFCASLLHLENPQLALAEVHRLLADQGVCFISVKKGEGEKVDDRTGYYFKYYQDQSLRPLFEDAGFRTLSFVEREGTPNHSWLNYHLLKI